MLMRKLLLLFGLMLGWLSLHADEYDYLWLHSPSPSATRSFALDDLRKITFGAETMSVWLESQSSPVTWSYDNLVKMTFESEPTTSVEGVALAESSIIIRHSQDEIRVESQSPLKSAFIYNVQGICIALFGQGETAASYSLRALPPGIYIVRAESDGQAKTVRFIKR